MEKEALDIKKDAMRSAWAMRGGLTYDQALELSLPERNIIADLIKENWEVVKKTKLPYF